MILFYSVGAQMRSTKFYSSLPKRYTAAEQAVLITILYSDIFSFPLTKNELWRLLIAKKKISPGEFEMSLVQLKRFITYSHGFYCLSGREGIILKRKKNFLEVEKKIQLAREVANKLSQIPSILFIGISGGLAVGNVTKNDDIDLVIIVKKNTVYASRLLILFILQYLGIRRLRNQKNTADMICVNLLFDETAFGWFGNHQDIYTAREIAQIVPLFERNDTYRKFINVNNWIQDFLPNIQLSSQRKKEFLWIPHQVPDDSLKAKFQQFVILNPIFETLSRSLQLHIMRGHQTKEIIKKNILAFHPYDYRIKTLRQLRLKMRQFGLLTNI